MKLNRYNEFLFDRINESMFYMSPNFKDRLSEIGDDISKDLIDSEKTDIKPDITFVDLDSKEGFITFTQINKADKVLKDIVVKYVDDNVDYDDIFNSNINDILNKGRNSIKIGKLINKIFPGRYSDKEIEEFVNKFKSLTSNNNEEFRLVKGEEIAYWYDCGNYYNFDGQLGNSCMKDVEVFDLYVDNPNISMLILIKDNKLIGRAIVWEGVKVLNEDLDIPYFMDRVYTNLDSDVNKFHRYAINNGWAYKTRNNYSSHSLVTYKGNQFNLDMMVKVNKESYDNYPYMDTFAEFLNGVLYNNPDSDNGGYKLTDTGGGYEEAGIWSEYSQENIPDGEAVWSDSEDSYLYDTESVLIRGDFVEDYYPLNSDKIYYDRYRNEYLLKEDSYYSEFHDEFIHIEDVIRAITSISDELDYENEEDNFRENDLGRYVISMMKLIKMDLVWFNLAKENIKKYPTVYTDWIDDYDAVSLDILMLDYQEKYILKQSAIRVYDGYFDMDYYLINNKEVETEEYRIEDTFGYIKRIWVDGDLDIDDFDKEYGDQNLVDRVEYIKDFITRWF